MLPIDQVIRTRHKERTGTFLLYYQVLIVYINNIFRQRIQYTFEFEEVCLLANRLSWGCW